VTNPLNASNAIAGRSTRMNRDRLLVGLQGTIVRICDGVSALRHRKLPNRSYDPSRLAAT
jgi:CTP:molybdopterin cytidylyltransferase MocA